LQLCRLNGFNNDSDSMNDSELNKLRDAAWRGKLTPAEEARLQAHLVLQPDEQADWEEDLALTSAIRAVPNAPLSSNFTAQVMQAVACEQREVERRGPVASPWRAWWHRFHTRLAWAALILLGGPTALLFYQNASQKAFVRNVAEVSTLAALPGAEVLQDFEAINQLRHASAASDEALIEMLR
jgi:hypothetical protein